MVFAVRQKHEINALLFDMNIFGFHLFYCSITTFWHCIFVWYVVANDGIESLTVRDYYKVMFLCFGFGYCFEEITEWLNQTSNVIMKAKLSKNQCLGLLNVNVTENGKERTCSWQRKLQRSDEIISKVF